MTTHRFKQFRVGDLFDIHPTKTYKGNNKDLFDNNGKNPVLGNTSMNNGIGGYSSKPCTENGGIITFSDTTTADAIFYQPNPFIGYSHVQGMYPYSTKWSEKSLLYFLTVFKKIAIESGFDYANKFNRKIASEFMVTLPVKCSRIVDISAMMSMGGGIDMSKIDTSTWKEFTYTDLFELLTIKNKLSKMDFSNDGKIPVYSSDTTNNGILGYTNNSPSFIVDDETPIYLVFGDHTKTMNIATESFCVMDNVKVLKPKINNVESLLFITTVWKKAIPDLGYARHWSVAKEAKFKLPVTEIEEIDFEYMAARIQELEAARIQELEAARRVMGLHDTKLTDVEIKTLKSNPKFKKFKMGALFDAQTGDIDLQQKDVNGKGVFFVNSGLSNCGIKGKTDRPAKTFPSNTITVDFWGNAFYRDFEYKMATHNHVFSLSGDVIKSERVGLYLIVQMSYFKNCFSYTNMGTWNKIKELEIELPITDSGELDFDYMGNYILAIEKQTIQKLYDDSGVLIDATKKVI